MGTDIRGFLEIKKGEGWEYIEDIPRCRFYDTFAILYGARNYIEAIPISEPKGNL